MSSDDILELLHEKKIPFNVVGQKNSFVGVAQLQLSKSHHLAWSKIYNSEVKKAAASVLILPLAEFPNFEDKGDRTHIFVDNPREVFRLIVKSLFVEQYNSARGLDEEAMFRSYDDGVFISPSATVSAKSIIGSNVIVHPGTVIYPNVKIGNNVEICAGCIIGAPGFGHVRQSDGTLEHFPHIGGVLIGDNVTIGNNSCIDSGGLSATRIGDGCKIGNLTQIAHNVELEENCLIGTRCQIAGGTHIGKGTQIWAGVTVINNLRIGSECNIKTGSIVISDLTNKSIVSGNFASAHNERMNEYKRKLKKESISTSTMKK